MIKMLKESMESVSRLSKFDGLQMHGMELKNFGQWYDNEPCLRNYDIF